MAPQKSETQIWEYTLVNQFRLCKSLGPPLARDRSTVIILQDACARSDRSPYFCVTHHYPLHPIFVNLSYFIVTRLLPYLNFQLLPTSCFGTHTFLPHTSQAQLSEQRSVALRSAFLYLHICQTQDNIQRPTTCSLPPLP